MTAAMPAAGRMDDNRIPDDVDLNCRHAAVGALAATIAAMWRHRGELVEMWRETRFPDGAR